MSSQYYRVTAYVGTPHRNAVEVTIPLVGPAGPAGPAGTGLETLTTQGDTLYRGASTGERLPIGNAGQVLKVVNGLPAWAAESGSVTSVNGETGSVVLDAGDVGAAIALEFLTISSAGSGTWTESLAANKYYTISQNSTGAGQLQLPTSANNGDRIFIRVNPTLGSPGNVSIVRLGGSPFIQQIGLLRGGGIFEAIWNGLWTANLPIAAGLTNVPSTPTADGQAGSLAYLDPYFYVCVANNNWRRIPVAAW
jgi:hypothetical protein